MASYYSQLEEAISKNEKELAHLQDELKGLRAVEKDTPRDSYQRQYTQILYHIDQEQRRLDENRSLKRNYDSAHHNISKLRDLRDLLDKEHDGQIRHEIEEEISRREDEVRTSMSILTDELGEEVRTYFLEVNDDLEKDTDEKESVTDTPITETDAKEEMIDDSIKRPDIDAEIPADKEADDTNLEEITVQETDEREAELRKTLEEAEQELAEAEEARRQSAERMIAIFDEERTRTENEGPFPTEEELDAFTNEYMRRKIEENEVLVAATRRLEEAKRRVAVAESQLTEGYEGETIIGPSPEDEYLSTEDKTTREQEEDSVEKARRLLSEAGIELGAVAPQISNVTQTGLVNQNGLVNIIDNINIIIPPDSAIEITEGRVAIIPSGSKETIQDNPKVKRKGEKVPHNGNEKQTTDPVAGPEGIPVRKGEDSTETDGTAPTGNDSSDDTATTDKTPDVTETDSEDGDNGDEANQTDDDKTEEKPIEVTGNTPGEGDDSQSEDSDKEDKKDSSEDNKDGSYRLRKEHIIQDEKDPDKTPEDEDKENPENDETPSDEDKNDDGKDKPRINPDGTYHLTKDQIIQDDLGPEEPDKGDEPKKEDEPEKDDNTPLLPPGKPTEDEPVKGETEIYEPKQLLYGPPPIEEVHEVQKPEEKKQPKRGLLTIMDELTDGLELKKKDGKRYKASNIKVANSFKEELKSGNYLYNIVHLVPAIVKLPFKLMQKISGKIMLRRESKQNIETLKERISKLSPEDLMTIYEEYRGSRVIQERFPSIINTLLEERVQQFAVENVTRINAELEQRYDMAFSAIKQLEGIDRTLADPNLSSEDRSKLEEYRANLLSGQAENIAAIRQGYIEANNWMSGGSHGFGEDMKAAATKLSVVGKRFAKDHDLDRELLHKQAQLERAENQAIADGNDEMALRTFIQAETILSQNTEISGSIFGRRSTGKKYYSPLAEQLDYRDDPFIRDLFTTIAITSATFNVVQSVKNAKIMDANEQIMIRNNQKMSQVNQMGSDIAGKRDVMMEGMEAQGMQDTLTTSDVIERAALDQNDWNIWSRAYRTADDTGHAFYNNFYDTTRNAYDNIANQYASGAITAEQAMEQMATLTSQTNQAFGQISDTCLGILKQYRPTHPQFDLDGVEAAMEYIQQNPDAITAMNQAMVDVTKAGDVLSSMQLEQLIPLTTVPDPVLTTIINGASTAALANNINNSMAAKKHTYGNDVTAMVDEYVEQQAAPQEERSNTATRR